MLNELALNYIQHLERGYCVNHPDVIAETQEQVVDRAVKELLEALQALPVEIDAEEFMIMIGGEYYGAIKADEYGSLYYSIDQGNTWQSFLGGAHVEEDPYIHLPGSNTWRAVPVGSDYRIFPTKHSLVTENNAACLLNEATPQRGAYLYVIAGDGVTGLTVTNQNPTDQAFLLGNNAGTILTLTNGVRGDFCRLCYASPSVFPPVPVGWWILESRGTWAVSS
jgi:hypothetical protein